MARAKSLEKRRAILEAAVVEIAAGGLGASTAKIAVRAGLATGTLFTYFASKDELLNELYLYLKSEVYRGLNEDFPRHASLEKQVFHVWMAFIRWGTAWPDKRKVSIQLSVSDVLTAETRAKSAEERGLFDRTILALDGRGQQRGMPKGFALATLSAMQEAAIAFAGRRPKERQQVAEQAFAAFWRMFR